MRLRQARTSRVFGESRALRDSSALSSERGLEFGFPPGRCRVDHEARYAAGESPGSGQRNHAAGQLREMIDAQLALSLPKTWIVRQAGS